MYYFLKKQKKEGLLRAFKGRINREGSGKFNRAVSGRTMLGGGVTELALLRRQVEPGNPDADSADLTQLRRRPSSSSQPAKFAPCHFTMATSREQIVLSFPPAPRLLGMSNKVVSTHASHTHMHTGAHTRVNTPEHTRTCTQVFTQEHTHIHSVYTLRSTHTMHIGVHTREITHQNMYIHVHGHTYI